MFKKIKTRQKKKKYLQAMDEENHEETVYPVSHNSLSGGYRNCHIVNGYLQYSSKRRKVKKLSC